MRLASSVLPITNSPYVYLSLLVGVITVAEQGSDDILREEEGLSG